MVNLDVNLPQIQLGLCDPPEAIYIYVGHKEINGETYLWYQYDVEGEALHPIKQRGLTGYLSELRITVKEFKGKENTKLDVVVQADQLYVIRSGLETNFSKTLLLALSCVTDFNQPLTVAVVAGEENVVFARLYDALSKQRLKTEWNANAHWLDLVSQLQQQLGQSSPGKKLPTDDVVASNSNSERVKAIRALTRHSADDVKGVLAHYGTDHPKNLDSLQCDLLIEWLVTGWYKALKKPGEFPIAEYRDRLTQLRQDGLSEADATKVWMSEIIS